MKIYSTLTIPRPITNFLVNNAQFIPNQKALTFVSTLFTRYFRKFHERHLAKLKFEPHRYVSYEART